MKSKKKRKEEISLPGIFWWSAAAVALARRSRYRCSPHYCSAWTNVDYLSGVWRVPSFDLSAGWLVSPRSDRSRNPFQRKHKLALKHPATACAAITSRYPKLAFLPCIIFLGGGGGGFPFLLDVLFSTLLSCTYFPPAFYTLVALFPFVCIPLLWFLFSLFGNVCFSITLREAKSDGRKREKEQTANEK